MHDQNYDILVAVFAGTLVILILASFGIIFTIIHKKKQQSNKKEKQLMKTQFQQELLQTQLEIQEQTFKNISQEIHDNVGQVLSLVKLNLNTFQSTENEYNQNKINNTKQLVSKAINDLRDLSRSLHGDMIAEQGLKDSIINEVKILQNTGEYEAECKVNGTVYKLESPKEMVLFRIVQEAMNNSIKHAKAKKISIEMDYEPALFSISVKDDGAGFDAAALNRQTIGIGLKSMQNRAAMIGGNLSIRSTEGGGTTIKILIEKI